MADSFQEVSTQNWFSRIGSSIKGIFIGFILLLISFPLLWMNEGCSLKTFKALQEAQKNVLIADSQKFIPENDGKLVYMNGEAKTSETLNDALLGFSKQALQLSRQSEMYQWKEIVKEETKSNTGGSETTTKTYTYEKDWASQPIDSSKFKYPEGHQNPAMKIKSASFYPNKVSLGAYQLSASQIRRLRGETAYSLTQAEFQKLNPAYRQLLKYEAGNPVLFYGKEITQPQIGDIKVTYQIIPPAWPVSIIAKQIKNTFESYLAKTGIEVDLIQSEIISAEAMIEAAQNENRLKTWLFRIGGFLLMAMGISMIAKPLAIVADFIPFLGSIVGMLSGFFAFLLAAVLSLITIALAWLAYRPIWALSLLLIAALLVYLIQSLKKNMPKKTESKKS